VQKPKITTRRAVLAGGAAVALTGAAIGVAAAQTTPPKKVDLPAPPPGAETFQVKLDERQIKEQRDKYFNTLAGKLGVGRDKLEMAMTETSKELAAAMGVPFFPMFGPPPVPPDGKGEAGVVFFGGVPKEKAEVDFVFRRAEKPAG
jgi:hypothetical protein